MTKEQKRYYKIGQVVVNAICLISISGAFAFYIVYALLH